MHINKIERIAFAITITMITLSNCFLNGMLANNCVENAVIEPHENHDDFFHAIDTGDIDQVANIVKQGKAPKKDDQRLNAYLAKVLTPSYRDELQVNHHKLIGSSVGKLVWKPVKKTQKYKQNEIIKQLIACGANIHYTNDDGWGYLHRAIALKNLGTLEILLSQQPKPNVNISAFNGATPLHVAAENDFHEAATMLLVHGANVNAAAFNGKTPLHIAAQNSPKTAKILLEYYTHADVNAIDSEGNTPLLIVLKDISDHKFPYRRRFDSYYRNKTDWMDVFKEGVFEEMRDLADSLITQHQADITISNKAGKRALDYALHVSEYLCYKLLVHGAPVKQDYFDEKKFPHQDRLSADVQFLPLLRAAQYADEIVKGGDPILKAIPYYYESLESFGYKNLINNQNLKIKQHVDDIVNGTKPKDSLFSEIQKDFLVDRLKKVNRTDLLQRIGLENHKSRPDLFA
ncbi:ankyrin repeat domain-containing protein [Candidatus Dependentiae bacterium]|nr:ankyrin repeat domain-containing protein [Candidatus Dependentiae bacterium]